MQELSLHVLDIAQNSVKAGATEVCITVCEESVADKMTILMKDNGCGMSEAVVARVTDPFYTTRTTRKVGLGIPFFKMAAEMTGGTFAIHSEEGKGTTVEAVFTRSHIDRMPLGDMAETMSCLISCNTDMNFIYRYTVDDASFCVSTEELKQVLDGVPLSVPEVVEFIKGYIRENSENLNGGTNKP